jgi:hypothetical protein
MDNSKTPFDSPWKEILEAYFPEFMAFFFPAIDIQGYCQQVQYR